MKKAVNTKLFFLFIAAISAKAFSQQMEDYTGLVFPANHALNTPVNNLPLHPNSSNYISAIGANTALHPDFGDFYTEDGVKRQMGIPYNVVGAGQALAHITFVSYPEESDPGPWPIPRNPYIETVFDWRNTTPGDRHMLIVDTSAHILYETGNVYGNALGTDWEGGCGAKFDLMSNSLRTIYWTSADAAGLPIFPLLIRYDEVERALATGGEIPHAIRFTVQNSQRDFVWPARHYASSSTDPDLPPMGLRFRLKANVDISGFTPRMQVILRTMKKYGIIVADNGSNLFFQGTHDERWDGDEINSLKDLHGRDFEAVDISVWINRPGFDVNSAVVPDESAASASDDLSHYGVSLQQNYPNPFIGSTYISLSLTSERNVRLNIYDNLGRQVKTLINETMQPGFCTSEWDGCDSSGLHVAQGVYFYQLILDNGFSKTFRMIILK